jgi:parafibromin
MINAEDFLVNGAYHTVEDKRKAGAQKQRELYLPRAMPNGGHVLYRVIDDPTKLLDAEWDLVVAVFATGQAWQFKGWKYSTPVTLFQHVLGVHVCIDSAAVDVNVQSWNCKVLKVRV